MVFQWGTSGGFFYQTPCVDDRKAPAQLYVSAHETRRGMFGKREEEGKKRKKKRLFPAAVGGFDLFVFFFSLDSLMFCVLLLSFLPWPGLSMQAHASF